MLFVRGILLFIQVVTSLLLIVVVLLQRSKSQGAGMMFGSGMGESMFGGQVGNVLTKVTVVLAAIFLVNTTLLSIVRPSGRIRSVAEGVVSAPVPVAQPPVQQMQPAVPEEREVQWMDEGNAFFRGDETEDSAPAQLQMPDGEDDTSGMPEAEIPEMSVPLELPAVPVVPERSANDS